jgi:hypothetical protein
MNLIFSDKYVRCIVMEVIWKAASPFPVFCTGNFLCLLILPLSFLGGSKTDLILFR